MTYLILLPSNLQGNIFHIYSFILYMYVYMYVCMHKYGVGLGLEGSSGTCHGRCVKIRGKAAGVIVSFHDMVLWMEHFCRQALSPTCSSLVVFRGMILNVKILVTCILITPPLPLSRSLFLPFSYPTLILIFFPQTHQAQFVLANYNCNWVMAWSVLTYWGHTLKEN